MVLQSDPKELELFKLYLLSVTYILYIANYPFNLLLVSHLTLSLDCIITFTNSNVTLHDQSSGWTIDIRCESQGLYYLLVSSKI